MGAIGVELAGRRAAMKMRGRRGRHARGTPAGARRRRAAAPERPAACIVRAIAFKAPRHRHRAGSARNQCREAVGFLRERMRGGGRLLGHGSVLLGRLVHLADRGVDLLQGRVACS